jgi:hypothetical protein
MSQNMHAWLMSRFQAEIILPYVAQLSQQHLQLTCFPPSNFLIFVSGAYFIDISPEMI